MRAMKQRLALAGTAAVLLVGVSAGGANAASLYVDKNWGGGPPLTLSSAKWIGVYNDEVSSVKASGTVNYYENADYKGYKISLTGNQNSLSAYTMSGLLTWNDKISSFK